MPWGFYGQRRDVGVRTQSVGRPDRGKRSKVKAGRKAARRG
jgi:hypothetical protein